MGVRFVHLVRHGHAEREGAMGLTPLGFAQASCIAARLAAMKQPPTSIRSSTLLRAKQTAALIHAALPSATLLPPLSSLCEGFPSKPPPDAMPPELADAEPAYWAKEARRHLRAWRTVTAPTDQPIQVDVVVAHGNVIASMAMRALGLGPETFYRTGVGNCGLTSLLVDGPKIVLLRHNDTGHIPATLVPQR